MKHKIHHHGLIVGDTGGRTDNRPIAVARDSYVLPADFVGAMGENNTLAGGKRLDGMFPAPKKMGHFASGGHVPIVAAAGEYVLHPDSVRKVGRGNLKHGHQILEAMVKHVRSENIKKQKGLEPPKK